MIWLQLKRFVLVSIVCYLFLIIVSLPDNLFDYFGY